PPPNSKTASAAKRAAPCDLKFPSDAKRQPGATKSFIELHISSLFQANAFALSPLCGSTPGGDSYFDCTTNYEHFFLLNYKKNPPSAHFGRERTLTRGSWMGTHQATKNQADLLRSAWFESLTFQPTPITGRGSR